MDIKLNLDDRFRINTDSSSFDNFVDVGKEGFSGIGLTLFTAFQYIEVRKKGDQVKVFTFPKKSHKKEHDFGFWEDAEVVYSLNEQIMHKD